MKFLLLVYNEEAALDALPEGRFDSMMHDCLVHADELAEQGTLLGSQQLEPAASAKSAPSKRALSGSGCTNFSRRSATSSATRTSDRPARAWRSYGKEFLGLARARRAGR